jgi:NOL1/NOP2/sun family putative RNA methylase
VDLLERYKDIIPEFDEFKKALSRPLPVTVRINTLKTDRERLLERLENSGISYQSFAWYPLGLRLEAKKPGNLIEHLMGHIHTQEEISMVPAIVLNPKPGEHILDLCAAPGSKTTQISQQMENQGLVVANEPSSNRIVPLRSNCERLGAVNVAVTQYDGRFFPSCTFDKVLVDAPCSGVGMARKDPYALSRWNLKKSLALQRLQVPLLKRAVELTRTGGRIVYSTCTFAPEENEAVINHVLDMVEVENVTVPKLSFCPGVNEWNGEVYSNQLRRCARYYPHQNDTGGFFVANLIKK